MTTERKPHRYDQDGTCSACGHYGAGVAWELDCLRMEIGDDEFKARWEAGEFDYHRFCQGADSQKMRKGELA